ncbi:hypothetical protein Q5P01_025548 [Channa striata]|uniref:Pyrin domain-containing protein n=1 Tax=Channa striata TaxID=64152 RepID=A0AA88IMU1_CHASR|nr:hypothetical protein Q5P01_025548 [Channa striata]
MLVAELLEKSLEDLLKDDFEKFKWYLTMEVSGGCEPIPKAALEDATRWKTSEKMIESYGEALAVKITVEVLKKIPNINAAEKLQKAYAATGGQTAATCTASSASAPPAVPSILMAQQGSTVIAPMIYGSTCGSLNINNK